MTRHFKHSGRRAFLRTAAGTALGLPLLEYTHGGIWSRAKAAQNNATRRLITVFDHGGTISNMSKGARLDGLGAQHGVDLWRPADPSSEALVLGPIHQPLATVEDRLMVLEGIDNRSAINADQYGAGGHTTSNNTALRAGNGASIDQVVADRLAARQATPFSNFHLKVQGHNYGSPYYRAAGQRVDGEENPQAAFDTLFAGVSDGTPDPVIVALNEKRTSILQGLQEGYDSFRGRVSSSDLHAIDAHLDHLRALETQLQDPVICSRPTGITNPGNNPEVVASLHADIIIAALRCGLTNVINLELTDILTPWTPSAGLRNNLSFDLDIGHALGHNARDIGASGPKASEYDDWMTYTTENRQWRMSVVAKILEALDDPTFLEGGRTMLDNSLMLVTSEFSNGSQHIAWNVPVLLAGSAGGYLQTGRFVSYNDAAASDPNTLNYQSTQSLHNLFVSVLQAMGENDTQFGDGAADHQGPLPGLT